ncbi:MAG: phosphoribosyl-ATP diphosphatase, partial [Candidatus Limnocylindrales bacterium]
QLWTTIAERAAQRPGGSYTTSLLEGGVDVAGRKVTEEATEVLMAAKDDAVAETAGAPREATRQSLAGEAADLLFHLLVLLAERNVQPSIVLDILEQRRGRPARTAASDRTYQPSTRTIR